MSTCPNCGAQLLPGYSSCPQCRRPVPREAQAKAGRSSMSPLLILVLVGGGLVVLVAFLGIVAALLIPNFLDALQKAKQKRTMADLRNVSTALGSYASDAYTYPQPDELAQKLAPKYLQSFPAADGWGRPFKYECWGRAGDSRICDAYVIASAGRDGVFTESDLRAYDKQPVSTTDYDADLVIMDGEFVRAPQLGSPP